MPIKEADLPLVLPASVARVQPDGRPTKPTLDNEFASRQWYLQNAVDLDKKLTTVEGSVGTLSGSVDDLTEVVANPDGSLTAQKLSTVAAQGTVNSGKIVDLTEVVANPDGSLTAGKLTSLSTTVGGNTASISTLTASVNGVAVKYGVQGTINGVTGGFVFSGIQQLSGGALFGLEINANVTINGNLVVTGSLTTPKMAYSSINTLYYQTVGAQQSIPPDNVWHDILVFSIAEGGDGAYAFCTLNIIAAIYVATSGTTSGTAQPFFRVVSDSYGDVTGNINPVVGAVDVSGNGTYGSTNFSFIRPQTDPNEVFRLQAIVQPGLSPYRYLFIRSPTALFVEVRKR